MREQTRPVIAAVTPWVVRRAVQGDPGGDPERTFRRRGRRVERTAFVAPRAPAEDVRAGSPSGSPGLVDRYPWISCGKHRVQTHVDVPCVRTGNSGPSSSERPQLKQCCATYSGTPAASASAVFSATWVSTASWL